MSTRLQTRSQPALAPDFLRPRNSGLLQRRQTKAVDTRLDEQPALNGDESIHTSDTPLVTKSGHQFSRVRIRNTVPVIQLKLTVGEATSEYEKEADRVADRILLSSALPQKSPNPLGRSQYRNAVASGQVAHATLSETRIDPTLPRCGTDCAQQRFSTFEAKPLSSDQVSVGPRSHALEPAANLQKQEMSSGDPEVTSDVESHIGQLKGAGHPLPASARAFFEPRFGHDFSQVRLHTDSRAADVARRLGARAFTVGTDIGFGTGYYAPETSSGRHLLAHELTHTLQQRPGASLKVRLSKLSDYNDKDAAHDPSKLTDAEIEATDEFNSYMNPKLIWQTTEKMTKEEARLATRLMLRHMREGNTVVWASDARVFMNLARSQGGTLKKAVGAIGTLQWVAFDTGLATTDPSKLDSDFAKWILAGGAEPDKSTGKVNCWEMVMFSAFKGGFTTKARITSIYNEAVKQVKAGKRKLVGDTIEVELRRGNEYVLDTKDPKSIEPLPGDIVIFSTAANHVAISRGTKDGSGKHKVISHWPPPDGDHKTKETTIEDLVAKMKGTTVVKFWSPKW